MKCACNRNLISRSEVANGKCAGCSGRVQQRESINCDDALGMTLVAMSNLHSKKSHLPYNYRNK